MFIPIWLLLSGIVRLVEILLLVRVLISWVPQWSRAPWGRVVIALTEPILFPLRRIARIPVAGNLGLDLSPMVALLLIQLARMILPI